MPRRLITELDAYQSSLYPAQSNHLDPVDELDKEFVRFVGAYDGKLLIGCGAAKVMPGGYGEIKRVYIIPQARGQGAGHAIMDELEGFLIDAGLPLARLETGIRQPEALALYASRGYRQIGPFGEYSPDPLSVFMEKRLCEDGKT